MLIEGHDVVLALSGVEAQEGAAAQGEEHIFLIQGEGEVVGGHVRHVVVTYLRIGSSGDTQVVHTVFVGVDVALVLPDELGALLDEGELVLVEGAAFLTFGRAGPPPTADVLVGGIVDIIYAKVTGSISGKDPGLSIGSIGTAGEGVETRGIQQAVVVLGNGNHLGDGGTAARGVQGHGDGIFTFERIGSRNFVTFYGASVAQIPQGYAAHRGAVLQLDDVGSFRGGSGGKGQLVFLGSRSQLVGILVHRTTGEQKRSGRNQKESSFQ